MIAETGATAAVGSSLQVPIAVSRFERYSLDLRPVAERALPPQVAEATPLAPGGLISALALRQPVGVVACITSYNFPLVNMAGKVAPALAMGNTVVVKPAAQDPLTVVELVRILEEVGFPPGVVNLVNSADAGPAAALVDSPDVDMISFTGSTEVGTRIAAAGAATMKRLLLELGRQGCVHRVRRRPARQGRRLPGVHVELPLRADLHRTHASRWCSGASSTRSSRCCAGTRARSRWATPPSSTRWWARSSRRPSATGSRRHIASAVDEGARLVVGGGRPAHMERGFYVEPTLFVTDNVMAVARQEIFGPVLVVIPFDDESEAVAMANDSDFGLYDYVFSSDTARAFAVAQLLRAGHVGINTAQRNHEAPFGGFKMSGVGRDGGDYGLEAYSELQSIVWTG